MNGTVKKLMCLADDYANTKQAAAWSEKEPLQLKPEEIRQMWSDASDIRQALEAELTRLFTPLSDEVILENWMDGRVPVLNFAREIEAMHGIG